MSQHVEDMREMVDWFQCDCEECLRAQELVNYVSDEEDDEEENLPR